MILRFKKREDKIEAKELQIEAVTKGLHKDLDNDISKLKKVNKMLDNTSVTFRIYKAIGVHHDR
jgi:hypothetical protein